MTLILEVLYSDLPKQIINPLIQKLAKTSKTLEKIEKKLDPSSKDWERQVDRLADAVEEDSKAYMAIPAAATRYREEQVAIGLKREEKEARKLYEALKARFDP